MATPAKARTSLWRRHQQSARPAKLYRPAAARSAEPLRHLGGLGFPNQLQRLAEQHDDDKIRRKRDAPARFPARSPAEHPVRRDLCRRHGLHASALTTARLVVSPGTGNPTPSHIRTLAAGRIFPVARVPSARVAGQDCQVPPSGGAEPAPSAMFDHQTSHGSQ